MRLCSSCYNPGTLHQSGGRGDRHNAGAEETHTLVQDWHAVERATTVKPGVAISAQMPFGPLGPVTLTPRARWTSHALSHASDAPEGRGAVVLRPTLPTRDTYCCMPHWEWRSKPQTRPWGAVRSGGPSRPPGRRCARHGPNPVIASAQARLCELRGASWCGDGGRGPGTRGGWGHPGGQVPRPSLRAAGRRRD